MDEKTYDKIHNEGGEGYNPYRNEREKKEREEWMSRPKSLEEQSYAILRKLEIRDCSSARECGTYDQEEINRLRIELSRLDKAIEDDFILQWPVEETKKRREEWNKKVNSGYFNNSSGKMDLRKVDNAQREQGWTMRDLKKAIKINNL